VGAPWGRLESFRVTMLDPHMLSTKRSDILSVKVWGAVRAALQKEGAELGVKLEFKVVFLEPGNLQVLDTVQPVENEAVAICCLMGLHRSSACPEAGAGRGFASWRYCTVLYCAALHCAVLSCTVLCYIVLHCSALHGVASCDGASCT